MRNRRWLGALSLIVLLSACARVPLGAGSPAPTELASDLQRAIEVREGLGLRADEAWVRQVAADPDADTETLDIPLTREEADDIQRRFDRSEEAAQVATAYGEEHPESFAGLYVDQQHAGRIVVRFTSDVATHQAALDALWGKPGMFVVELAQFTQVSLQEIQRRLTDASQMLRAQGISLMEIGSGGFDNVVEVVAKSDDPRAKDIIVAFGPPGAIRVELHPADKPWSNAQGGEGWRLLGSFEAKLPYTVAFATTRAQLTTQLDRYGIHGLASDWDPSREIVALFGYAIGSSCPEVRIDGITIDRAQDVVYGNFSDPWSPRACTADLRGSVTFVVALERDSLPESPFRLRLERDLPPCDSDCPFADEEVVVDLR